MLVSGTHSEHWLTVVVDLVFCSDKSLEFDYVRVSSVGDTQAQGNIVITSIIEKIVITLL